MNKITLEKVYSSGDNYHVKFLINGNDVGILYLKEEEANILLDSLRHGVRNSETVIDSNIYDSDDEDFDIDNDV